ncbi:hypothetical protein AVEN_182432-1 [Araneus ventricosus]|uniref:Endonuclease/exonuclease/phosphatase domain-containing protein n=1 Tax=Araneus ventricosus TaxID=182803 RepID=A0A4Y2NN29_ARAVE|nr:hypothetical protein AVEN_182432-1 [Araneus ventricosus]
MHKRKAIFLSRLGPDTTNFLGLRTKTVEFYSSVSSVEYDVICVTETWLCEDIDSWHLFDERYIVYRGSSSNFSRPGGGVLVAIKKCLYSRKLDVPGLGLEAIWISVKLNRRKKMILCVVYFPPSSHVDTSVFKPITDFEGNDGCKSNCLGDLVKIKSVTYDDVVLAIREWTLCTLWVREHRRLVHQKSGGSKEMQVCGWVGRP